jgi:hypothetical protein
MKIRCALGVLLILTGSAWAHRLDEYLQATLVAIRRDAVELHLDLTPGVAILSELLPLIDPNNDGRIDRNEENAYCKRLLRDIHLDLDGRAQGLEVVRFLLPPQTDLMAGEGTIQLTVVTRITALAPGRHTLLFRNDHLPKISVYLVNALRPEGKELVISGQARDDTQRHYRLDFDVASQ